jgi:hypothetical protein
MEGRLERRERLWAPHDSIVHGRPSPTVDASALGGKNRQALSPRFLRNGLFAKTWEQQLAGQFQPAELSIILSSRRKKFGNR